MAQDEQKEQMALIGKHLRRAIPAENDAGLQRVLDRLDEAEAKAKALLDRGNDK